MQKKSNVFGLLIIYILIALFIYLGISSLLNTKDVTKIEYSELVQMIEKGEILSIEIDDSGYVRAKSKEGIFYKTYAPNLLSDQQYVYGLASQGIQVQYVKSFGNSWWVTLLTIFLPLFLFIIMMNLLLRPAKGSPTEGMTFIRSPAKKYTDSKNRVTFDDVAGVKEAKEELQDIIKFLKDPKAFTKLGARMPKGVLLVGPPGTGKTLLARAVAGEANVPFFYISGSDFVELFVGVGAARVRDLFNQAKAHAPSIIFIDEIDAVGRQRGAGLGGGHDEREQTLNAILVEMDGFDPNIGVIVMAATNRPDVLDRALLRPGRFDKKIVVDIPDAEGRKEILKIHFRGKKVAPDVDLDVLARATPGFVGADLENLVNEAALLAARSGEKYITMAHCEEAIERVIAGPERKTRILSQEEKEVVAYHELGHAILATLLPNADPVHKVTIIPRGYAALGYTLQLPTEDKYLMSKSEILDDLVVLLGGRAAEEIVFRDITTGAENDLKRATIIARKVVAELGMSEKIGPVAWSDESEETFLARELFREVNYSDETAKEIDFEIKRLINDSYEKAKIILLENKEKLDLIAKYLLEKEAISGEELKNLLEKDVKELENLVDSLFYPKTPEYERTPHYEYFIGKNKFIEG
ncbi:MAG TPA: ATP-dependent zinc metalloprotease FtsH [Defluviitoga sp.]|nr:ATP-dependent zinc metalloprotease FtsH [Defluviitoga sp.]HOP24690.1 ATP-dependent zinc metalloprotease FtsH [Defluviitoga sp.]HPZ29109.1 ATP-dependent zinc metalloprotease FtsH [Defluviitoga sp.]HQD63037.1 ATP-dependent zinc metalloprotease FtsH [Defluviitoga sp.]